MLHCEFCHIYLFCHVSHSCDMCPLPGVSTRERVAFFHFSVFLILLKHVISKTGSIQRIEYSKYSNFRSLQLTSSSSNFVFIRNKFHLIWNNTFTMIIGFSFTFFFIKNKLPFTCKITFSRTMCGLLIQLLLHSKQFFISVCGGFHSTSSSLEAIFHPHLENYLH